MFFTPNEIENRKIAGLTPDLSSKSNCLRDVARTRRGNGERRKHFRPSESRITRESLGKPFMSDSGATFLLQLLEGENIVDQWKIHTRW